MGLWGQFGGYVIGHGVVVGGGSMRQELEEVCEIRVCWIWRGDG
jgi:hypothetical protein